MSELDDAEWVRQTVLDELDAILDRLYADDKRTATPEQKARGRTAMATTLGTRIARDIAAAAELRALGTERVREIVREMVEPEFRKAIAHKRPS